MVIDVLGFGPLELVDSAVCAGYQYMGRCGVPSEVGDLSGRLAGYLHEAEGLVSLQVVSTDCEEEDVAIHARSHEHRVVRGVLHTDHLRVVRFKRLEDQEVMGTCKEHSHDTIIEASRKDAALVGVVVRHQIAAGTLANELS